MRRLGRVRLAAAMNLRDLVRRPLILVLLVVTPIVFISRAISNTEPLARTIRLADGSYVATTMRSIHGADMTTITVAFLSGLIGIFIMQAARQGDARLVRAGFGVFETVAARLVVLLLCVGLVVSVALGVTSRSFSPQSWTWFALANLVIAVTYGGLGAVTGSLLGRVGATYVLLFMAMLDLGIVQNPMFGSGSPPPWAVALPGYPATRAVMEAALSESHGVPGSVVAGMVGWLIAIASLAVWRLTADLQLDR